MQTGKFISDNVEEQTEQVQNESFLLAGFHFMTLTLLSFLSSLCFLLCLLSFSWVAWCALCFGCSLIFALVPILLSLCWY